MTAADLIVKYLEQLGVEYIFGVPGGALEPLYEAMNKSNKVEAILAKHECGAAFMAGGYARVSGRIGVCCATTGPGSTNLITGVASAYCDSIPLLAITAQAPTMTFGKTAFQEASPLGVDIIDIFKPFTKYSAMVLRREKVGEMLRQALRNALTGRKGPVHLNIPLDIMREEVSEAIIPSKQFLPDIKVTHNEGIKKAAALLMEAENPAAFIGHGTLVSGAAHEILQMVELLSMPVATTPKAKGLFPEDHPLSLGVLGIAGSPQADAWLLEEEKVDILLAVGTTFNELATHNWDRRLIPTKAMIQLDIDPAEMGKNYPVEISLLGDAKETLRELKEEISGRLDSLSKDERNQFHNKRSDMKKNLSLFKNKKGRYIDKEKMHANDMPLKPQRVMADLRKSIPHETAFFIDCGNSVAWTIHYLDIYKPYSFFSALGFASMGSGITSVIGGKFADPARPIVAISGDGSFLMNGTEVATTVNYDRPVIWVVLNDSQLGMVAHGRRLAGMEHTNAANYKQVDFVKFAESLGANGMRITKPGQINKEMWDEIIASGKSTVLDVIIDGEEAPPLESRVRAVKNAYFN